MHPAVAAANAFKAVHEAGHVPDYEDILRQGYSRFLKSGDIVVDVGAHLGRHLLEFTNKVGAYGKVYAFEPIPALLADLKRRFDGRSEVELHQLALSNEVGIATFTLASALGESGLISRYFSNPTITTKKINVDKSTLDHVLDAAPSVTYIKMDIEGGELDALRGARRLLSRCRPIISVEYGWAGYSVYGYTQNSLFHFCNENNYACSDLVGNIIETEEIWLAVSDFVTWDFFLVPKERTVDWGDIFGRN